MTLSNTYLSRKQLLADNLNSMGVSSVDANDGLTTLINAVLDIEPSIGGLDLDTAVNITANPSTIIVGQSVILTSKLTASYDDETVVDVDLTGVLTGATIQYKEGNTVLGTGITDNTGVATCTVSGLTLGTHTVKAVFQGTENFNDCESNNITITVNNPEPASITLAKTDGKQILSYVDSAGGEEFCELTATVVDSNNSPVPGVNVTLYKDGTVWDTVATDVNGEVTKIYNSAGVGDVEFYAECGSLVSETCSIHDYQFYADSIQKIKNTFIKDTSVSGRTIYISPFTFNSDVELEFKLKNIPNNWVVGFGSDGTTWNSKGAWFKLQNYNQNKASIMWQNTSGGANDAGITTDYGTSTVFTIKSENINKIYWYLDSVVKASRDTHTGTPLGLRFDVFDNQDYDIEYIKVKP